MKHKWILSSIVSALALIAQAQWSVQFSTTEYKLANVIFTDETTGFAWGTPSSAGSFDLKSVLFATTNAGATWTNIYKNDTVDFRDVFFTTTATGYIVGQSRKRSVILKTTDGGRTWASQPYQYNTEGGFHRIYFTDREHGFIFGSYGLVLHSSDAGASWAKTSKAFMPLYDVSFPGPAGYAIGRAPTMSVDGKAAIVAAIFKTSYGGANWSAIDSTKSENGFRSFAFPTSDAGYVWSTAKDKSDSKNHAFLWKTTNGGDNWTKTKIKNIIAGWLCFFDATNGYNVTTDSIYRTANAGVSWKATAITVNPDDLYHTPRSTKSVFMAKSGLLYAVVSRSNKHMIVSYKSPTQPGKK